MLNEAINLHSQGQLHEAKKLYHQILEATPDNADALHLLGVICIQTNDFSSAEQLIIRAIESNPNVAAYYDNLAIIYEKFGDIDKALQAVNKSIELEPEGSKPTFNNLGNFFARLGEFEKAMEAYHKAIAIEPEAIDTRLSIGSVLYQKGETQEAIRYFKELVHIAPDCLEAIYALAQIYRQQDDLPAAEEYLIKSLEIQPEFLDAIVELGEVQLEKNEKTKAIATFQSAHNLSPKYPKALYGLGDAYIANGNVEQGVDILKQHAILEMQNRRYHVATDGFPLFYLKHEIDQIQYLISNKVIGSSHKDYLSRLQQIYSEQTVDGIDLHKVVIFDRYLLNLMKKSVSNILHFSEAPRLNHSPLNLEQDFEAIEEKFFSRRPNLVIVDNVLSEEALVSLRKYCLESTIWKNIDIHGPLGTTPGTGFLTPLLCQISNELKTRLPTIFKSISLSQAWGFSYDSSLKGLDVHADYGKVNCNLWLTPNEACLDPASSGLVVWDKKPPTNWPPTDYTDNTDRIEQFLKDSQAKPLRIPYKENRMVIFDSDLFHKTDDFKFQNIYTARRMSISLLYGKGSHAIYSKKLR